MDWQNLINLVGGAALAVIGWFARQLWDAVQKLKSDMSRLELSISDNYVKKDDFKEGIKELKEMLGKIFDKLDTKADR
jgi:chaperonin cofactor prefoldin